jgi:hypothetical protein
MRNTFRPSAPPRLRRPALRGAAPPPPGLRLVKLGCPGETTATTPKGGICRNFARQLSELEPAVWGTHTPSRRHDRTAVGVRYVQRCRSARPGARSAATRARSLMDRPRSSVTTLRISDRIVRQGRLGLARPHGRQLRMAATLLYGCRQALRPARELAVTVGTNGPALGRGRQAHVGREIGGNGSLPAPASLRKPDERPARGLVIWVPRRGRDRGAGRRR